MPAILTGLAPEVILAIGLLAVVASYMLARALIYIWEYTIGGLLSGIAKILPGGWKVLGHTVIPDLSAAFRGLESAVHTSLQNWATGAELAIAGVWHAMGSVWKWNAGIAEWLAKETANGFEWLIHVRTPKITRALIYAAFPAALLTRLIAAQIAKLLPHVSKYVRVIEHTVTHTVVHTVEKVGAVALPGPLGIPQIWRDIRGLTKRLARIHWRLSRLEALLGVAGMAAAIANVLGLPNWRCLTRGNIGRVARKLCGLGPQAIEDLLGLIADVVFVADICEVIVLLGDGLKLIQPEIDGIVSVVGSALCHGDYSAAPDDPAMTLSLPPVTGLSLSLAA